MHLYRYIQLAVEKIVSDKEFKMYESQIVEVEDMNFGHYINHFEDFDKENLTYEEMFEMNEVVVSYDEELEEY